MVLPTFQARFTPKHSFSLGSDADALYNAARRSLRGQHASAALDLEFTDALLEELNEIAPRKGPSKRFASAH